jgi:hypothetical protein
MGSSGAAGSAQTPEERRAAIDRQLNDTLGTFDAQIKKEREGIAKEHDAQQAAAAAAVAATEADAKDATTGDGEPGTAKTEHPGADGNNGADGKNKGDQHSRAGDLKSDKDRQKDADKTGSGGNTATGSGAAGSAIPDGSDDDIVARRLRKAAEQETDPELKEKLWKEYIEYKKNAGK